MYDLKSRSRTALLAYKNLSQTQFSLNNALQRLSSGLSINIAADDSASSSLSTRMNNQTKSVKQANRNTQDTYNLSATAEPSLSDLGNILSKIRELSVQVSTDTLNNMDRASIDLEFRPKVDVDKSKGDRLMTKPFKETDEIKAKDGDIYEDWVDKVNIFKPDACCFIIL